MCAKSSCAKKQKGRGWARPLFDRLLPAIAAAISAAAAATAPVAAAATAEAGLTRLGLVDLDVAALQLSLVELLNCLGRIFRISHLDKTEPLATSHITVLDLVLAGRHQRFRTGALRVAFGTPACRREEARQRAVALSYLDRFELGSLASLPVTKVPYGSRKLVDLARALATEPKVLVLDEPAAGVSAVEKSELVDILSQSRGRLFGSLILIEHDVEFVRQTCERLVVLDFGDHAHHRRVGSRVALLHEGRAGAAR